MQIDLDIVSDWCDWICLTNNAVNLKQMTVTPTDEAMVLTIGQHTLEPVNEYEYLSRNNPGW